VKQTGVPIPQVVYGYQLQKVTEREKQLIDDPKEKEVIAAFQAQAAALGEKLKDVPAALAADRAAAKDAWTKAKAAAEARAKPLAGMPGHAQQFAGDPNGDEKAQKTFDESRRNFLALVFCLMVGTPFDKLPAWIANWTKVDPALLSVTDVNKDGIFQLGEMRIGGDIIVLATPEIAGLPYVVSGMVAAGGLAAALSTADGLLLTIANALSHDLYYKMMDPNAPTSRRVMISKVLLLVVALMAAYVAAQKPADILFLVSAAFSLAAAGFFPALTLGIFWKRATKWGAILGMIAGFGITFYYMATTQPWLRSVFGVTDPVQLWWGIQPISAGIFGVPVGFLLPRSLLPRPGRGGPAWAV